MGWRTPDTKLLITHGRELSVSQVLCVWGEGGLTTEPGPGVSRGLLRGPPMTWT